MPAAYAHHRFGDACLDSLPEKLRNVCLKHRELFDIGVHGPDILFYYKPLNRNKVNTYGQELHRWTGQQFFTVAKYSYQHAEDQKKAMLVYLLGFLAHFVLDSGCHDFINEEAAESGISHNKIESQYEAFLMRRDGKDPMKVDRSLPLHPTMKNAEIIARYFPLEEAEVLKSLKGQKTFLHLFYSPTEKKKQLLRKALDTFQIQDDVGDLFLDREILYRCSMCNDVILKRQKAAVELYPRLAKNLLYFLHDREDLDEYFQYNFEGEL